MTSRSTSATRWCSACGSSGPRAAGTPLSVAEQGVSLYAVNKGYLDDVAINKIVDFEAALLSYMRSNQAELMAKINEKGDYNDDIEAAIKQAVEDFKANHAW